MKNFSPTESRIIFKIRLRVLLIALLSFLLMVLAVKNTTAQKLRASVYLEQNVMGVQKGAEVSTQLFKTARVAYFFQATNSISMESDLNNYPYHGMSVTLPVKRCDGLAFWAGIKTGLVNGQYFIATPQMTTEFKITRHIQLGLSAAYRAGHPALGSFVSIQI